jgi:hypothetical protein
VTHLFSADDGGATRNLGQFRGADVSSGAVNFSLNKKSVFKKLLKG